MVNFKKIMQCLFSPRLFYVYRKTSSVVQYKATMIEDIADTCVILAQKLWYFGIYTAPFVGLSLYKFEMLNSENIAAIAKFLGFIYVLGSSVLFIRACYRAKDPTYLQFLDALNLPKTDRQHYVETIRNYDFDFRAWPISYNQTSLSIKIVVPNDCSQYTSPIMKTLGFVATETFGLRLIYPGTLSIVNYLLGSALTEGRRYLVENYNGKRAKLKTPDGNFLDTMFVDNRSSGAYGHVIVVCCEGNSAFYEIGIMTTPIKAGFSAIGWNHPGFANSTGTPHPDQEQNAIDTVMQYVLHLGFKPPSVVLFGWSIGAYAATCAAVTYPEVRALILDATFDDILPLALAQMPKSWESLVREVIRSNVNLHIAKIIEQYKGPLGMIRRTQDEIIALRRDDLSSNRSNELLIEVLRSRFPSILGPVQVPVVRQYLSLKDSNKKTFELGVLKDLDARSKTTIGLIPKYLKDYKSTHCTPLPEDMFLDVYENIAMVQPRDEASLKPTNLAD